MKNVLLLETIDPAAMKILRQDAGLTVLEGYSESTLDTLVSAYEIHVVITRGKGRVNVGLMDACPQLQIIARCGVGLDNIAVEEATKRGVRVLNTPNANAATIAEHSIALLLLLQRQLNAAIADVKTGNWNARNAYRGDELRGKTMGILGLGNIGKKVALLAEAFGMNVCYWGSKKQDVPYPYSGFDTLLENSDCISIHLPLTSQTEGLLNRAAFAKMHRNPILINTARGKIIDEQGLLEALNNGRVSGFAADVLCEEPPQPNNPLVTHPKALVTAHIGSLTKTTYREMCLLAVNNVRALVNKKEIESKYIANHTALSHT